MSNSENDQIVQYNHDIQNMCMMNNPFLYLENTVKAVEQVVDNFLLNSENKFKDDAKKMVNIFLVSAEKHLYRALIYYLLTESDEDEKNLAMVVDLIIAARANEDEDISDLERLFKLLGDKDSKNYAYLEFNTYLIITQTKQNRKLVTGSLLRRLKPIPHHNNPLHPFLKRCVKNDPQSLNGFTYFLLLNFCSLEEMDKIKNDKNFYEIINNSIKNWYNCNENNNKMIGEIFDSKFPLIYTKSKKNRESVKLIKKIIETIYKYYKGWK